VKIKNTKIDFYILMKFVCAHLPGCPFLVGTIGTNQQMPTRAFLAHCSCEGDVCRCDYNHFPSINSESKSKMPNTIFDSLSAAERKDIANKILDLPYEQQREFVEQLSGIIDKVSAAESSLERKKTALNNIQACRCGSLSFEPTARSRPGDATHTTELRGPNEKRHVVTA
jgi:hypothetical protein